MIQCPECLWRYLPHRAAVHRALHDLLPLWPCPIAASLGPEISYYQFPLDLIAVLLHGLYQLQPQRQVLFFYSSNVNDFSLTR